MLHRSINHVSITVSDFPSAIEFFAPILTFLGYTVGPIQHDPRSNHDLTVNINETNGSAFNVERHEQVDELHRLVRGFLPSTALA